MPFLERASERFEKPDPGAEELEAVLAGGTVEERQSY